MDYTDKLAKVYKYSLQESHRLASPNVSSDHLILGILRLNEGVAIDIFNRFGIDKLQLKKNLEMKLWDTMATDKYYYYPTRMYVQIRQRAVLEARKYHAPLVGTEHLLLAYLRTMEEQEQQSIPYKMMKEHDMTYQNVQHMIRQDQPKMGVAFPEEQEGINHDGDNPAANRQDYRQGNATADRSEKKEHSSTPALDAFGTDITQLAAEKKLDPVVGRDAEIDRIVQILCRRKKNNPVLIGDPGVGKSAIVEGIAQRIVERRVSRILYDKRIVSIDLAGMVAGTKYRGQFEERIKTMLAELRKHPEIILFIDEIHTIVGAGGPTGTLDAANMLKPSLANGNLQCIGATTLDEYRNSIEKDGALERRFQKVIVEPTSTEDTLTILRHIADRYEYHHNVKYTEDALEACVKLTDRYVSDRVFPDKAIDALDESGARMHVKNVDVPPVVSELEKAIDEVCVKKNSVLQQQQYEQAVTLRDRERELREQLEYELKRWQNDTKEKPETVNADVVADVVSLMSGVPVQRIAQSEGERLRGMRSILEQRVIGQDKAIDALVRSIQRNRLGIKDPNRPVGSFLFLGPTGVGKTHLARTLAETMFGSADALIRVDMSEYMEKFSVSRLIGAPPGYVGYEEGGQLTEKVRRKPYSIVLLDEIEKAHPDVFNLLLQVMDEGRLTDSLGRRIDFKNAIIIMTSNVGSRQLKDFGRGIGFYDESDGGASAHQDAVIRKALNKTFSPEFLNRVDEIITFESLSRESIHRIIDIELKGLFERIRQMGYEIQISQEAKDYIADQGYDPQYGARPLRRAIQHHVEDKISDLLLESERPAPGSRFHIDLLDGAISISIKS